MEPKIINTQSEVVNKHSINQVTPLSKYLAMFLFVSLPFIGGWVGYLYGIQTAETNTTPIILEKFVDKNNVATGTSNTIPLEIVSDTIATTTEKDIFPIIESICTTVENPYTHLCYKLVDQNNNVISKNLTELAKEQKILPSTGRAALYSLVYKTDNGEQFYFKTGIPDSGACCGLIEFSPATRKFANTNGWYGIAFSRFSESGQYIGSATKDGKKFQLIDLEQGKVIFEEIITSGSLVSTKCGAFGEEANIEFSKDNTKVYYSIYNDQKLESDNCNYKLLETKEYPIL